MKKILFLMTLSVLFNIQSVFAKDFPIRVMAQVNGKEITLGDNLEYKLNFEYPADYKFSQPDFTSIFGNFEIKKQLAVPPKTHGGFFSKKHNSAQFIFDLTNFNLGEQKISSFTVSFITPLGETKGVQVPDIIINVKPVPQGPQDGPDIRDIKLPLSIGINKLFLLAILILILAGIYIFYLTNKKQDVITTGEQVYEEKLSPEEIANKRLNDLIAGNLIKEGKIKEFYIELSEIIRRYLSDKYQVPVIERTTEEVCRDLKKAGQVDKKRHVEVREFLENCDLVKFAKYIPVENEISADVEKGRGLIKGANSQ